MGLEYWANKIAHWNNLSEEKKKKARGNVRKGVPERFRAALWKRLLDTAETQKEKPALYEELLAQDTPFASQITRDLNRTLPNHVFFQSEGLGRRALFNVLKAYSIYCPSVGYCQGMGFIVAMFLLHMPEEDAFFSFLRLFDIHRLHGLFEPGFPLLHRFFWIQEQLMEQLLPAIHAHFKKHDISTDSYSTQLYTTLFVPALPHEYTLRVWDVFLAEGQAVLFRVVLALLKLLHDQLLKSDFEGIFTHLRGLNRRRSIPFSPDDLINTVCDFKTITASRIEKLDKKYLQIHQALTLES